MRKSIFGSLCLVVTLLVSGLSPAMAQQAQNDPAPVVVVRMPVAAAAAPPRRGGLYDFMVVEAGAGLLWSGGKTAFVFGGGMEAPITAVLMGGTRTSIAAEITIARADAGIDITATTIGILGGIAIRGEKKPDMKMKPFGRVLAGLMRSSVSGFGSSSAFAIQFGGGFDYEFRPDKLFLRVKADIPIGFFEGGSDSGFRLMGGIVMPIGQR